MYQKCRADSDAFAHTRLSSDPGAFATGGWLASVHRLHASLKLPHWQPDNDLSLAARKRSLAKHRIEVITPAVTIAADTTPPNPPLPWAWIAQHTGSTFPDTAFTLWWQLRALGQPFPAGSCPWCSCALTSVHLTQHCLTFAQLCWTSGIHPDEAFAYPADDKWFVACLLNIHSLDVAISLAHQQASPPMTAPSE